MPLASSLPVEDALPSLRDALARETTAILTAPPGAGKSTLVPLRLLDAPWLGGNRIVMLEPRRLAARAVAARMAAALGENVGHTVGYRVRGESRTSAATRIEVVTEGLLTRSILAQPDLAGVGLVIFDEFHERSIHADLGLALARRVQALFRDDLRLLVMSATIDETALSRALGGASIVTSAGRAYPVELEYAREDVSMDRDPSPSVSAAIRRALRVAEGDVLAFLPGKGEISRVESALADLSSEIDTRPLHGDLTLEAQQAAIAPSAKRRVILATNVAETSLTIDGVRVVVDSGLARVARFDPAIGLPRLETARVAKDSADQRAGRAGRTAPGRAFRLWTPATQHGLAPARVPELADADLTSLALDLAIWGERDSELSWILTPSAGGLAEARRVLHQLGALRDSAVTPHGRAIHELGAHPRLGHLLLEGRRRGLATLAADVAASIEERDPLGRDAGADLALRIEALRHGRGTNRIRDAAREHRRRLGIGNAETAANVGLESLGLLVSLAYPERIAQRRPGSADRYRLTSGRGARLNPGDPLTREEWLAVAHVDARDAEGRILLAAALDPSHLESTTHETVRWDAERGVLVAQRETRLGELIVDAKPLNAIPGSQRVAVLLDAIRREDLLPRLLEDEAEQLLARVQSLRAWGHEGRFPDMSLDALRADLENWLGPAIEESKARTREDLLRLDAYTSLQGRLDWQGLRDLDRWAPRTIEAPTGSKIQLRYAGDGASPILAVRLQEIFGWLETPTVNEGRTRVTLHLLSPARRPVQATQDLRSFWANTYSEVRKELRARYPKHSWPEDPLTATPIRGPKKRA